MKVVIPAAGMGKRLRPYTVDLPKSLIKIKGKPIIEWQLDIISKYKIGGLVIILGHKGDLLKKHLLQIDLGFPVTFIENKSYDKTHAGYSLALAREELHEGFYYINADLLFTDQNFKKLVK